MVSFVVVLTATTYLLLLWGDNQPVLWALNFQHANVHVWHRASVQYRWPVANKKRALLSSASVVLFASDVVRYRKFLLAIDSFLQMFGRHSNSQTFASGYFYHSQTIKITRILRVCDRLFRAPVFSQ